MKLAFLKPLYERPGPWASVYFGTALASEDAAARQELGARGVSDRLQEQGADAATCRAVYSALDALPRSSDPPGYALFAADGEVELTVPLAGAPSGPPPATWTALPHVAPLAELADAAPPALVALVDRTGAELEVHGAYGTRDSGGVSGRDWPVHRTPSGDWSERHFQNAVEDTWEENAATVAQAVSQASEETGADLVVLAGDRRACRAVHDKLPQQLRDQAVEAEHGGRDTGGGGDTATGQKLLAEEVERVREDAARRRRTELMERFQAGRVPDGDGRSDATEGVPNLVEAARQHRIATLLVRPEGPDLHREVWVGDDPEQLAVRRTETRYLGDPEPSPARADDALLRSAAVSNADVECVHETDLGSGIPDGLPVGGLGALLRWPYGGTPEEETEPAGGE